MTEMLKQIRYYIHLIQYFSFLYIFGRQNFLRQIEKSNLYYFQRKKKIIYSMGPIRFLKDLIIGYDYFNTTQLLRYSGDPEFKTLTGGICSLSVVACVMIMLVNMSLETFNKEYIEWEKEDVKQSIPSKTKMNIGDSQKDFMFGVQIQGLNLSDSVRLFDVQVVVPFTGVTYQMETCRAESWNINQDVKTGFDNFQGSNWLCPVAGQSFDLAATFSSSAFQDLKININSCTNGSMPGTTCHSQATVDFYFALQQRFILSLFFINTIINPNDVQPVSYFLDDSNYIFFTNSLGVVGELQVSDYEVKTDQSFMPYETYNIQKGFVVKDRMFPFVSSIGNSIIPGAVTFYSGFHLRKSSDVIKYTRSFRKVDFLISYAGGLIGAVIGLMFFMNIYTKICYEITMGSRLFRNDENQQIQAKSFNVFRFLGYGFFHFWHNFLGCNMKWKAMQVYDDCKAEAEKQLDIKFILEKLIFFEQSIQILFGDVRFKGLHLMKKNTLSDAKKYREMYYLKHSINSKSQEKEENQQEKKEEQNKESETSQNQSQMVESIKSPGLLLRDNKVHNIGMYNQSKDLQKNGKEGQKRHQRKMISIRFHKKKEINQKFIVELDLYDSQTPQKEKESVSAPSDCELVIQDETFLSLAQIKMEAQSGNLISLSIWQRVEEDLKQALGQIAPTYFQQIQNPKHFNDFQKLFKKEAQ